MARPLSLSLGSAGCLRRPEQGGDFQTHFLSQRDSFLISASTSVSAITGRVWDYWVVFRGPQPCAGLGGSKEESQKFFQCLLFQLSPLRRNVTNQRPRERNVVRDASISHRYSRAGAPEGCECIKRWEGVETAENNHKSFKRFSSPPAEYFIKSRESANEESGSAGEFPASQASGRRKPFLALANFSSKFY